MPFPYVRRYYLIRLLYILSISFTKTTFFLYLRNCHHLTREDILLIFAVFNFAAMFFEVPTSAMGELIGPRRSFLLGAFCKLFAAAFFSCWENFSGTSAWQKSFRLWQ